MSFLFFNIFTALPLQIDETGCKSDAECQATTPRSVCRINEDGNAKVCRCRIGWVLEKNRCIDDPGNNIGLQNQFGLLMILINEWFC